MRTEQKTKRDCERAERSVDFISKLRHSFYLSQLRDNMS